MPSSKKTAIIEDIFFAKSRYDKLAGKLKNQNVSIDEVYRAIMRYNRGKVSKKQLSPRNPANFLKDIVRSASANSIWPASVTAAGYTAEQLTGDSLCFRFTKIPPGQATPFSAPRFPEPLTELPHPIETISLPLASRRLGRKDEPWLAQVLIRQRVIEAHLAIHSPLSILQLDHLQMSVKLRRSEIDAIFLAIEQSKGKKDREILVCCEAKALRDEVDIKQLLRHVRSVFAMPGVTQNYVLPLAVKSIGPSLIQVLEFGLVSRDDAITVESLTIQTQALYRLTPPIVGIGE